MIKYESKEKLVKFDTILADRIVNIIQQRPKCKETVVELLQVLQQFFASRQEKEELVTLERKETEEEAVFALGEEFVSKYEEILDYCKENELLLYIHGTQPSIAQKILQEGLNYKIPSIESTTILQNLENPKYAELLNWPHQHYEGLVLLGIPKESFGEIWNKMDNSSNQVTTYSYNIGSEFLLGMLDISSRKVIQNPNFSTNHDYDNLLEDNELSKKLENFFNYHEEFVDSTINTNANIFQSSQDELLYINDFFEECATNSNINECIEFSFDEIANSLIQFSSYGHIGKTTAWVRECEVLKALEISKRVAKYLFEYKNHFITQNTLDYYGQTNNSSWENEGEDFTISDDW